jgi:tetratricopeptide (TPR) repeat protein
MTFAKKHIEEGDFDEALRITTEEIDAGTASPETFVDRAMALELLERHADAAKDFERALELDRTAHELIVDDVDDAYFSALVSAAEKLATSSVPGAVALLDGYANFLPEGRHRVEAEEWKKRVRGELKTLLDKTKH